MEIQIKDANYALLEGDRDGVITILGERQDMVDAIWLRAHASPDDTERNTLLHQVFAHQDSTYAPLAADILRRETDFSRQLETPPGWQFWKRPGWQPFTRFVSRYRILVKRPSRHMGDGRLTTDLAAYELPGVPWVSYFTGNGIAFHGAYWHDNFGSPTSHGCLNMRNADARWIYRWSTPPSTATDWQIDGYGTRLDIS